MPNRIASKNLKKQSLSHCAWDIPDTLESLWWYCYHHIGNLSSRFFTPSFHECSVSTIDLLLD